MRAARPISRSVAAVVSWVPAIFLAVNGCGVPSSSVQWAPGGPAPPPVPSSDKHQVLRVTPTGIVVSFK